MCPAKGEATVQKTKAVALPAHIWVHPQADIKEGSILVVAVTVPVLDPGGLAVAVKPYQPSVPFCAEIGACDKLQDGQGRAPEVIHSIWGIVFPIGDGRGLRFRDWIHLIYDPRMWICKLVLLHWSVTHLL